ncbi:MAG: outer membrane protein assembly factor BamD [Candidatus Omnitrophota bacterium]
MRKLFLFLWIGLFLFFLPGSSYGFWVWSPKRPALTQPKRMVKPSPKEQLAWALSLFETKEYARALQEMENLARRYPQSPEAAEAQFYIGRCHEELGNDEEAFKAYEEVVKKYPNSDKIQEVIEHEYRIANLYYGGKKRKVMKLELFAGYEKAVEIYRQVVAHAPYGAYAELSQYKVGECYKKIGNYKKAREAFEKLIEDYPRSELVNQAKYQIALTTFRMSREADYDEEATDKAIEKFSNFVAEHPESNLAEESQGAIRDLQERKAKKAFDTAEFYAKQKAYPAARIYYNKVIGQFPKSSWASRALEQLTILEKKEKP